MEQKELKYDGKQIRYRVSGNGPSVVLLHGFGEDGFVWDGQVKALAPYRLVIPDLPGSGGSEAVDDMSMEGLAAVLHQLLQSEGIDRPIMIGHSMGGYITLAFADQYGDRLAGFGLFHSTAYADTEEKKETRRKGIRFIREHGPQEFLRTSIPNLYSPEFREEKKAAIERHLERARNFSGAALVSYYESMIRRPDRSALLQSTRLPVLFVLGRQDTAVPLQDGLKQSHLPARSYVHILERSGHMGMIEEPEKSNALLAEFISDIT